MLVLSRKVGQKLVINDEITIVVNRIAGNRVSLGIEAPQHVHVVRGELQQVRGQFAEPNPRCGGPNPPPPLQWPEAGSSSLVG